MTDPVGRVRGRYAVEPGGKPLHPSVTMVLGLLNKDGLSWGAAKETALRAITRDWLHLPDNEAYNLLRLHHKQVWDAKAAKGTAVHNFALAWTKGEEVECPPDCEPYLDALERFYKDWQPETILAEQTVVSRNRRGLEYAGTPDWLAQLNDGRRMWIDYKTGGRYPIETTLQLNAYRGADGVAHYSPMGGLEKVTLMPESDGAAVLYLHDDGTYEFLVVPTGPEQHEAFLWLRQVWGWHQAMTKWEKTCKGEQPPAMDVAS